MLQLITFILEFSLNKCTTILEQSEPQALLYENFQALCRYS